MIFEVLSRQRRVAMGNRMYDVIVVGSPRPGLSPQLLLLKCAAEGQRINRMSRRTYFSTLARNRIRLEYWTHHGDEPRTAIGSARGATNNTPVVTSQYGMCPTPVAKEAVLTSAEQTPAETDAGAFDDELQTRLLDHCYTRLRYTVAFTVIVALSFFSLLIPFFSRAGIILWLAILLGTASKCSVREKPSRPTAHRITLSFLSTA